MKVTIKKSLALLLSVLMVISVMTVGVVSASAATITCETLFLQPSLWNEADARFAAYFYDLDGNSAWADANVRAADAETYKVSVPDGEWTNVIFCRMNPAYTENDWNSSTVTDRVWNQTGNLEWDGESNCFTMSTWTTGAWSTYTLNQYCIVGDINGSNVGDSDDYQTVVNVIDESTSLTLTITETSYVYLKDYACENWYMTQGWLGEEVTTADFYNTETTTLPTDTGFDKLYVPAGIHTFSLTENADGSLNLSYEKIGEAPTTATTTTATEATTASTAATTKATEATEATVPTGSTATVISGTNMAKGKTVTASCTSELSATDANYSMTAVNKALAKLTNGTKSSVGAWFNNGQENVAFKSTVVEGPYSLVVDLGQGVSIDAVQLYAYQRSAWGYEITDKVTYSISTNGTDWKQIGEVEASETGYTYYNDSNYTDAGAHVYIRDFTLQCKAIKARYVKATFPANTTTDKYVVAFNEFEVYGTAATLPEEATGTNLASGKTVTATCTTQISTANANYSMSAVTKGLPVLVDGVKDNYNCWLNNGQPNVAFNSAVLTGPYTITVDLGTASNINKIALYNYERMAWSRMPVDSVKYSVSADGTNWTTVGTVTYADASYTHITDPGYTDTGADVYINDFTLDTEASNVRYVKATFSNNSEGLVIFNEFEVYGEEVQEETTESTTATEATTASTSASTTTYETYPELRYYPACDSSYTTLYSAMVSVNINPSLDNRTRIAAYNGIEYEASATQNTELLNMLKAGTLLNPDFTPYYELVGYIDGQDLGCNADADNSGLSFGDEMKLTNYFNEDSYVFVKTADNVDWFMASSYTTDTSAVLHNTSTGVYEKLYVPAGKVELTLTVNSDGTLTLSYSVIEYPTEAPSYTIYDTKYYPACDSSYTGLIAGLNSINVDSSKEYRAVIAEFNGITDYTYTAEQNTTLLNLLKAGTLLNPEYVEPTTAPKKYYSLVGNINGVDVGFDSDYQSIGIEFDDNGNLTYTFTEDSYVFVKTTDNANWYMTNEYVTDTTATFTNTTTGSYEKMLAPAGTLTFKLVENSDGTITLSYTASSSEGTYTVYDTKYYPACDSSHVGLVAGLSSINVENSQAYRMKIALFNGMTDYAYTAEQNTTLLNLLKEGKLLNPEYTNIWGDANGDDKININDVTYVQLILAHIVPSTDTALERGDVDGNGELSIRDATYIQMYIAKYIETFPAEEQ